jgi:hypothetical protein
MHLRQIKSSLYLFTGKINKIPELNYYALIFKHKHKKYEQSKFKKIIFFITAIYRNYGNIMLNH